MRTIPLGKTGLQVPAMAVGCRRLNQLGKPDAHRFLKTALEQGLNFFDHADIYGGGDCEDRFAEAVEMNSTVRETLFLQSKCGVVPGVSYDSSMKHIVRSVDGILRRLRTDYLDVLLLHRPDALVDPEEVAEAVDYLQGCGKVRHFGVSNHSPMQIRLLQRCVRQPVAVNQLQLSLANATMISSGLHVNMLDERAVDRDGGVLDFCRLEDITVQAWSPLQFSKLEGAFVDNDNFPALNLNLRRIARRYNATPTAIALAWVLRHPAKIQPIAGTTNIDRLLECISATEIHLTREEWYELYLAAGNTLP